LPKHTNPSPPNRTCTLSAHPALQIPCFPPDHMIHPDQPGFQTGPPGALRLATTMAPPSPYLSRDVGDPLVTQQTWFIRRPPLRRFLFPRGWLGWEFCTDTANVRTAPNTGLGPLCACEPRTNRHDLGSSNAALTIDDLPDRPLAPGTGASPAFSHHATVPSPFRVQVRCWFSDFTPVAPLPGGNVCCASQGAPPCTGLSPAQTTTGPP
jgi:hypothetical protein